MGGYYNIPTDSSYAESTVCSGLKKVLQSRGTYHYFSSCKWSQKCYLIADQQIQRGMYCDSQREKGRQQDRWGGFVCYAKKRVTTLVND